MAYDRDSAGKLKSAVMQGDVKAAKRLIKGGTDVNSVSFQKYWKTSLLHEAVITGKDEMVQVLLNAGCDANSIDLNGNTALHLACRRNKADIVNSLLKNKARTDCVNEDGYTALRIALWKSGCHVVESLLNAGAQPKHCDQDAFSTNWALNIAVSRHDLGPSVIQTLIDKGAKINHSQVGEGNKAKRKHGALDSHFMLSVPDVDSIRILIQNGADPFQSSASGNKMSDGTALATDYLHPTLGQFLIKTLRRKEPRKSPVRNLTKVLENCTDHDIVDDLMYMDQPELRTVTETDNSSHSQSVKKPNLDIKQSEKSYLAVKSLSHKCRIVIRRHLSVVNKGGAIKNSMTNLPLPKPLIDYIACKELVSLLS